MNATAPKYVSVDRTRDRWRVVIPRRGRNGRVRRRMYIGRFRELVTAAERATMATQLFAN